MLGIVEGLKPGGRVVLLEYRSENPMIMIKGWHKMSEKQVKKEMKAVGLVWEDTRDFLPKQHFLVLKKPDIYSWNYSREIIIDISSLSNDISCFLAKILSFPFCQRGSRE